MINRYDVEHLLGDAVASGASNTTSDHKNCEFAMEINVSCLTFVCTLLVVLDLADGRLTAGRGGGGGNHTFTLNVFQVRCSWRISKNISQGKLAVVQPQ